jgi:hypothetical protein
MPAEANSGSSQCFQREFVGTEMLGIEMEKSRGFLDEKKGRTREPR